MLHRRALLALGLALFLLLAVIQIPAQTVTGTLSGHVKDKTGAVIAKAQVKAVNVGTGAVRDAVTNDEGFFQISFVALGTYNVTASLQGFRTVEKKRVVVD